MSKYDYFCDFFDYLVANCKEEVEIPETVQQVYDNLREQQETEKPMFTEAGLSILEYLQSAEKTSLKAKDIAEGMGISSRKVSGAIRKLCTDSFVEKAGKNPTIYSLSDKGKEFDIASYKETLNN